MENQTENNEVGAGNAFENLIHKNRKGVIAQLANEKMTECIDSARQNGAMATLTVTIKFKPTNDDQMMIDAEVKNALPKEKIPSGMMYVDEDNCLHTSDPKQSELPLREVEKPVQLKEAPKKKIKEA